MIEIKLSQGAKPGHGGMLPGAKVSREIAETRGVPEGEDCISPARHSAFDTPRRPAALRRPPARTVRRQADRLQARDRPSVGMVRHRQGHADDRHPARLHRRRWRRRRHRRGTDGIHRPRRRADARGPDARAQHPGRTEPARARSASARPARSITAFDIARTIALGADWCNAARGFMFALGCIQSQTCHTDHCPTGVATQDPRRWHALNVPDKAERVKNFHQQHAARAQGTDCRGRPQPSRRTRSRAHHPARFRQ